MGGTVRTLSESDALDIMRSDGVVERLKVTPEVIEQGDLYLVNDRMLLVLIEHSENMVEAHIAQPKSNWTHIHTDIDQSLIFIQSVGYNKVYTNVRESLKTTLNLLKKHGFKHIDMIDGEVILLWPSKQHY